MHFQTFFGVSCILPTKTILNYFEHWSNFTDRVPRWSDLSVEYNGQHRIIALRVYNYQ